ncbi:hypothetical protein ACTBUY_001027 [Salmonella enterica subsp. enterica]|nr:hypothetical protein [Salmonella enterica subsp. enterica]ECI6513692.1 hypothetical protein [Salmonella enterica subsp. enterica]ELX5321571.1 hypothetical protein [Salmonella enterica]
MYLLIQLTSGILLTHPSVQKNTQQRRIVIPGLRSLWLAAGKRPIERLRLVPEEGRHVNAPDGLFQRIAADIQKLRASGMNIMATDIEVFDSRTEPPESIPLLPGFM